MRQRRRALGGFAIVAGVMLAVLSWLTVALLRLDLDERQARQQAAVQERLRLALWRMDSWLSPQLALESMRPASDYLPFPSAATAWTRGFAKIGPDEVVVQSPLLGAEPPLFRLHFEVGEHGFVSPQVPTGNQRDFAEANGIDGAVLDRAAALLRRVEGIVRREQLEQAVGGAEALLPLIGCNPVMPASPVPVQQSVAELNNRQQNFRINVVALDSGYSLPGAWSAATGDGVGPLVPVWVDAGGGDDLLVYARRVRRAGSGGVQGVFVEWPALQRQLLALVEDLFGADGLRLCRCERPTPDEQPSMLASLPARLVVTAASTTIESELPIAAILWTTWGVTLLGLAVLGFTLRTAIGYGERRARFASAVTHELRTPLTTFQLYSEMLADGLVTEPAAQREYLTTLQRESSRLARVVENVLVWSRLEEGRFASRRERTVVGDLVDRFAPTLGQRLGEVGMTLAVEFAGDGARDAVLATDADAVGQVLFNLVDNAAKYARGAADPVVRLEVARRGETIELRVCDRGPGIAAQHRQRVFVPFDRGAVPASSNDVPGVGLGLPLARGLARDLGGDLRLADAAGGGACFVLELPVVA